jgi:hypothetical protein
MVTKLDRFARNVTEGIKLVKELFKMKGQGACAQCRSFGRYRYGQLFHYHAPWP